MSKSERFYDKLAEIIEGESKASILSVPGVWDCIIDDYSNTVLDALEAEEEDACE